ncbi:MAG: hypothetical protein CVV64_03985 [Candidatus Wallbacteria bacterium HGW-Wallbacteria-1]|jgi:hypothetical protein|uniref:Uncharacterized protein n=1 Tax=Candidatus Wallbacteria bacterium HGW-Wallbacteria-1 TaxID=2013854 RepID=A0A2N1PRG7_9BACT|nr:MAG: hypothetical protein CVV64_03985 [Candidatus Wallbacteria bacterium HGW-Wallbacteria-1]
MLEFLFQTSSYNLDAETIAALEKSVLKKCEALLSHQGYVEKILSALSTTSVKKTSPSSIEDVTKALLHILDHGSESEKRQLLKAMIKNISFDNDKFAVHFKILDTCSEITIDE